MKKALIILSLFLFCSNIFAANQVQITSKRTRWNDTVQLDRKIISGADSTFTANHDTLIINGSLDSAFTKIFYNHGKFSVSIELIGGSTNEIAAVVQVVNSGDDYSGSEVPDSLFQTSHWLKSGTGLAGNIISTSLNYLSSSGDLKTTPMTLYIENAEVFRILFYSTSNQVGNPRIVTRVFLKRDGAK